MFNRKLKKTIKYLEEVIEQKDKYIFNLRTKIEKIEEYKSKMPEDCVCGTYCEVCQFVKVIHIRNSHDSTFTNSFDRIFVCGKSEVCPNFITKGNTK